jgi:tRNA modification GTPase
VFDGEILDESLLLGFAEGASFTGEAVLEIQCHGSIAVVNALLAVLARADGFRAADSGEFTRRALENGRLDLPQVEALADLIDAETEMQRRVAAQGFTGTFSREVEGWRKNLIRVAALIEATIDFADEDIPVDVSPEVLEILSRLHEQFEAATTGVRFAERLRDGFEVAIVGAPNVGKSTLLNALSGRDAALTSDFAGTTRDIIEVRMEIAGLPVTLLDTAGLRDGLDPVEQAGIARARSRADAADLRIFLGNVPEDMSPSADDLIVSPKSDISTAEGANLAVSGKTGAGLGKLVDVIGERLRKRQPVEITAARERHLQALRRASECLSEAQAHLVADGGFPELAAQDIREALHALDRLLGRVGVEDLLDEIFRSFCVGK